MEGDRVHHRRCSGFSLRIIMKTLEFKLHLNQAQAQSIDRWLEVQRWVWNKGLELLKECEAFSYYNKHDEARAPCCPIPWEYRWQKGEDGQWIAIPFSRITVRKDRYCCPVPQRYKEPKLDWGSAYSLTPLFAHKLHQDKPWYRECPYKITQGTIRLLAMAWERYLKGKRKSPRFKRCGDIRTLNNVQSGKARVLDGRIKLPKMDAIRVRSLQKRWPDGLQVKSYRIKKEPSGYYLLLVGEIEQEKPKPSNKACGLDAGVVHLLNDDVGHHVDIPYPLQRRLKVIRRLCRKASRQQKGSANQRKTYAKLAQLHERIRRDRKAWHHKLSTFAVRKYDAIAVEKLNLQGMTRRPKPKLKGDCSGYEHNMASVKAGLNRVLLDAGFGQLFRFIQAKSKAFGRRFEKVSPQYTSQTCNHCGVTDTASRRSQSEFVCVHCGHTDNADTNAAKNIRDIAFPEYREVYPALAGKVTPVEAGNVQPMKQEEAQVSPMGDAHPILNSSCKSKVVRDRKLLGSIARKSLKRRSSAETTGQLSIWDILPETG